MTDRSGTTSFETAVATAGRVASSDEAGTIAAGMARIAATFDAALDRLADAVDDNRAAVNPRASVQFAEAEAPAAAADAAQLAEDEIGEGEPDLLNLEFLETIVDDAELSLEDSLTGEGSDPAPQNLPDNVQNQQASFTPGPGPEILPGIGEDGPIDPTALQYRAPEYEPRVFGSDDDGGDDDGGGNGNDGPPVLAPKALLLQEGSTGIGNVAASGTEFYIDGGVPQMVPINYADPFQDGYAFALSTTVVDAASGLLGGVMTPGAMLTGITYLGNNDGNLGTVTDSFDAMTNQLTLTGNYGGPDIWQVVFDLDDGSYVVNQLAAYSHLGTPGDVLQEMFQFEVMANGFAATESFILSIADDVPETSNIDFFLYDVNFGSDGINNFEGNVLHGEISSPTGSSFDFRPEQPLGPIHSAIFPQGPDGSNVVQAHAADDLGADGGHLYSVSFMGVTYQRIWTDGSFNESEWLRIENGMESIEEFEGAAFFNFTTSGGQEQSILNLRVFFADNGDIEEGDFRLTLDPFDIINDPDLMDPYPGSFSYRVIDNDGDISAEQAVAFQVHNVSGTLPTELTAPTLDNLAEFGL
jgi:hypothetical protein